MTKLSLFLCAAAGFALSSSALAEPFLPTFSASNFSGNTRPTHTYFPVVDGQVRTYAGSAGESFVFTSLGAGPAILDVKTHTVRDDAYEGDLLIEQTFDYYAQDRDGNVWYMGEDVTNYHYDKNGNLISTDSASAWRAGVNGALPGYIMPRSLEIGFNYYQEHAPNDDALDQATTISILPLVTVEAGAFSNVLQVLETSEIDKSARGFKYYAPGRGLIKEEEGLKPNHKNPTQTFELTTVGTAARPALEFREVPKKR